MSEHTCLNCNVKFQTPDIQRDHYKTDWHRYNLKRRVADLPPVTAEEFQKRVQQQRTADQKALEPVSLYCTACRKQFISDKSYENHLNSKKHRENILIAEKSAEATGGFFGCFCKKSYFSNISWRKSWFLCVFRVFLEENHRFSRVNRGFEYQIDGSVVKFSVWTRFCWKKNLYPLKKKFACYLFHSIKLLFRGVNSAISSTFLNLSPENHDYFMRNTDLMSKMAIIPIFTQKLTVLSSNSIFQAIKMMNRCNQLQMKWPKLNQ